jgi:hypothetical protein
MSNNNSSSSGIGIFTVVGIVFVILKLVGVIDWSWLWVLAPFWISIVFYVLLIGGVFLFFLAIELNKERKYKKRLEEKKKE